VTDAAGVADARALAALGNSCPGTTGAGDFFLKKLNIGCDCGVIAFYETHWHFLFSESIDPFGL
jgi:hypothetical protein